MFVVSGTLMGGPHSGKVYFMRDFLIKYDAKVFKEDYEKKQGRRFTNLKVDKALGKQCVTCLYIGGNPRRYCKKYGDSNKKYLIVNNKDDNCLGYKVKKVYLPGAGGR